MRIATRLALALGVGAAVLLGTAADLPARVDELIGTRIVRWSDLKTQTGETGEVRTYVRAPTSTLLQLGVQATTLQPEQTPHPVRPHVRPIESVIIVKEGTLQVQLDDKAPVQLETGAALFLATNQRHTLRNASRAPVTYYEVDWTSPGMNGEPDYPEDIIRQRRRPGGE